MDIKKYLVQENVPENLHEDALECFSEAKQTASALTKYKLLAPLFMFWLIFLTKQIRREDDSLPKKWWKFDNNISINGDGWGTLLSDGSCLNYVDNELIARGEGQALQYGDPRYTGDCYYCKGYHPRSKWARYVWLGWRNRASAYAQDLGQSINLDKEHIRWGTLDQDRTKSGVQIGYCDGLWQLRETRKVFFGKLCLVRNLGYKINNAFVEKKPHAMLVWIPFSLKQWLGD